MINPTTNEIKREEKRDIVYQYFSETMIVNPNPVYIHPDDFSLSVKTETHIRHRGIFTVPVYSAAIEMVFDFNPFGALDTFTKKETVNAGLRLHQTPEQKCSIFGNWPEQKCFTLCSIGLSTGPYSAVLSYSNAGVWACGQPLFGVWFSGFV